MEKSDNTPDSRLEIIVAVGGGVVGAEGAGRRATPSDAGEPWLLKE